MGAFKNMGGNFPGGKFLSGNFPEGEFTRGKINWWEFPGGNFPDGSFHDTQAFISFYCLKISLFLIFLPPMIH